ncbi:MAG: hypothetical protein K6E12_05135 [Saccharofermentans sp.]|nr:hypothetical protein [Saccharofermentans sp.]
MEVVSDYLVMLLETGLTGLLTAAVVVPVVLFIVDSVKAKREHRKVKTGIKVFFIIGLIIAGLMIIAMIAFVALMFLGFFVYAFYPR